MHQSGGLEVEISSKHDRELMARIESTSIRPGDQVEPLTLGIQVINRGEETVVVTDFQVMEVEGMTVTPELLITQPRWTGQIGDALGLPRRTMTGAGPTRPSDPPARSPCLRPTPEVRVTCSY